MTEERREVESCCPSHRRSPYINRGSSSICCLNGNYLESVFDCSEANISKTNFYCQQNLFQSFSRPEDTNQLTALNTIWYI